MSENAIETHYEIERLPDPDARAARPFRTAMPCACADPAAATLLQVEGLYRRFPETVPAAVDGVSFTVRHGELLALLGPSGCGKTTTLRMIGGFEKVEAGTIRLDNREIGHLPPERRGIGFVFQDYALFPHLNVLENVMFGLRRSTRSARRERAAEMLSLVGLSDFARRMPHQLSGGQQQRVALARALALAPPLMLLDEPFSNLDAAMRVETRQEVRQLLKQSGSAAILVTHDQEEALALADRIAVMHMGRILRIGSPAEIYCEPESEFVARFLGRSNILDGMATGPTAETCIGQVPLARSRHGPVRIAIRPEQLVLVPDGENAVARIAGREYRGHDQLYWIDAGGTGLLAISGAAADLAVGTPVRLGASEPVAVVG